MTTIPHYNASADWCFCFVEENNSTACSAAFYVRHVNKTKIYRFSSSPQPQGLERSDLRSGAADDDDVDDDVSLFMILRSR